MCATQGGDTIVAYPLAAGLVCAKWESLHRGHTNGRMVQPGQVRRSGTVTSPSLAKHAGGSTAEMVRARTYRCPHGIVIMLLVHTAYHGVCPGFLGVQFVSLTEEAVFRDLQGHTLSRLPGDRLVLLGGYSSWVGGLVSNVWRSDDRGVSWHLVRTTGEVMSPRRGHGAVVVDDTLLVLGGLTNDGPAGDDCVFESVDGGVVWRVITCTPGWHPRSDFGVSTLSDGRVVLVGGTNGTTIFTDVWVSTDVGVSWQLVGNAAPQRFNFGFAALPDDSLFMYGGANATAAAAGTSEPPAADNCWRSVDGGATWTQTEGIPGWGGSFGGRAAVVGDALFVAGGMDDQTMPGMFRSLDGGLSFTEIIVGSGVRADFAFESLSDGSLMIIAGRRLGTVVLSDVIMSPASTDTRWYSADCGSDARGLCRAPVASSRLFITLPAGQGSITPATFTSNTVVALYQPPVPFLTPPSGFVVSNAVGFDVTWSEDVAGLQADDFVVHLGPSALHSKSLTGQRAAWTLVVEVEGEAAAVCPAGYTASPELRHGERVCGRAIHTASIWSAQQSACAPYHLATVSSMEQAAFFRSLQRQARKPAWYVHCCGRRVLSYEPVTMC